jgi:hypothetical protein
MVLSPMVFHKTTFNLYSQTDNEIETLFTARIPDCLDISYNCMVLIPGYYYLDHVDSALMISDYWYRKCKDDELAFGTKILFDILNKNFNEDFYSDDIINYLLWFKDLKKYNSESEFTLARFFYYSSPGYYEVKKDYLEFTNTLAHDALLTAPGKTDSILAYFYNDGTDTAFTILQSKYYEDTKIRYYYDSTVTSILNESYLYGGLLTGIWMPYGNNEILGKKPEIGFFLGLKKNHLFGDIKLIFRFLSTPNSYVVMHNNNLVETSHFFGGFIGAEFGYSFVDITKLQLNLLSGFGYDGFTAISSEDGKNSKSIDSFNFNLGLGFSIPLNRYWRPSLSFEIRYNWVNYSTNGGSDLSGDGITFRMILTWYEIQRFLKLDALSYAY